MIPSWAIIPAAAKLIVGSIRHPNTDKAIVIDSASHHVSVVPRNEAPTVATVTSIDSPHASSL
jgi:hypothetical protein